MAQDWPPGGGHINYNAKDEQVIQIQGNHSTAPPAGLQGRLALHQENSFHPFLTGSNDLFVPYATRLLRADPAAGRNVMVLGHDDPSSPNLIGSNFRFPFPSDAIESSQAGNCKS
ncbi:hypothetical protein M378DRAFT_340732 [Amanita muscaria Koide BX008]|uniref:Uncharacterized protein n=1 Tax=Amanita muscaria (strain Koide BX008) TaxID=946122 RepID=A0A0C2S5T9_AMAMK|nr:hypothetical protein M378DRAFT_340732 [Amanita muscaria Koide BX008]